MAARRSRDQSVVGSPLTDLSKRLCLTHQSVAWRGPAMPQLPHYLAPNETLVSQSKLIRNGKLLVRQHGRLQTMEMPSVCNNLG